MKVILSGGTGYIGSAVLLTLLSHPHITTVVILTRRPLPSLTSNPKLQTLLIKDFTSYDPTTINELRSADAAIWCLGTYHGDETIDVEFPLAFIDVVKSHVLKGRVGEGVPFRFVQLGGAFTEPPPREGEGERVLWYFANGRRVRGRAEARVLECAKGKMTGGGGFEVYVVKPGGVLSQTWSWGGDVLRYFTGDSLSVKMDELTGTMVDLAVNGNGTGDQRRILLNRDIIEHAKKLEDSKIVTGT